MGIQGGSVRAYSSCFMHAIVACMRLPFFQNIFNCFTFLPNFSNILPFFWKIAHIPILSRIGPVCTSSQWKNFFWNFETAPVNKVSLTFSSQNHTPLQLLPMTHFELQSLQANFLAFHNNLVSHVRELIGPWNFWKYVSLTKK